ncbi:Calcineurin B-like protein 2 [Ranunculus cassubicifolius]
MGCVYKTQEFLFTVQEVAALYQLFKKLSSSIIDDGVISKEELQLGLFGDSKQHSLFTDRIFDMFDFKHNGVIEFEEFVKSLSVFHPNTPQVEKITFAFQLYDIRNSTYIGQDEVKEIVVAFLDESGLIFSEDIIESIIFQTFPSIHAYQSILIQNSRRHHKIDIWLYFAYYIPNMQNNVVFFFPLYAAFISHILGLHSSIVHVMICTTNNK